MEELPPKCAEFIEWLVDPENRPWSKAKWARENGVHNTTVYQWLKKPEVRRAIDDRAAELNMSPDRIQNVMNAIYSAALGGDMKASQLYLQHVDRLKPKVVVIEDRRIESLSDEELKAELARYGLQ